MYLHWKGCEIDGSDTDFDLVLPQLGAEKSFVEHFLSIPLFGNSQPNFYKRGSQRNGFKSVALSHTKFMEALEQPDRPCLCVDINCCVMDALPPEVCRRLYQLSETREPHEEAFGKVSAPCMAPVRQTLYTRGNMTVSLTIQPLDTKKQWYTDADAVPDGYVNNLQLLCCADNDYPCISINVGPSFYFEYAMFIVEYLQAAFPGLATAGGLDCGGGWIFGCTYACSIYGFEKLRLPVKYSVRNTIKYLTAYDILCSYRHYYQKTWHYERISGYSLVNHSEDDSVQLSLSQYEELVETALSREVAPFETICDTAVQIMLPESARFQQMPEIHKRLLACLKDIEDPRNLWNYLGYASFLREEGRDFCEIRIPWQLKSYFLTLLELADQGLIDDIKSETYLRRQKDVL